MTTYTQFAHKKAVEALRKYASFKETSLRSSHAHELVAAFFCYKSAQSLQFAMTEGDTWSLPFEIPLERKNGFPYPKAKQRMLARARSLKATDIDDAWADGAAVAIDAAIVGHCKSCGSTFDLVWNQDDEICLCAECELKERKDKLPAFLNEADAESIIRSLLAVKPKGHEPAELRSYPFVQLLEAYIPAVVWLRDNEGLEVSRNNLIQWFIPEKLKELAQVGEPVKGKEMAYMTGSDRVVFIQNTVNKELRKQLIQALGPATEGKAFDHIGDAAEGRFEHLRNLFIAILDELHGGR